MVSIKILVFLLYILNSKNSYFTTRGYLLTAYKIKMNISKLVQMLMKLLHNINHLNFKHDET